MEEMTTRTLPEIANEIRYLDRQAKRLVLGHAIEIGNRLLEAKELVPHGQWGDWLKAEFDYSQSSAQNFMRISAEYGETQMGLFGPEAKSQTLGNLPYTKALKLLAVPENEREEFVESHDIEGMSTRELDAVIKERDDLKRQLEDEKAAGEGAAMKMSELEEAKSAAEEKLINTSHERDELKFTIKELESRPQTVAVEQPDPEELQAAIDEAVEKARKESAAAMEKALDDAKTAAAKESAELVAKLQAAEKKAEKAQKAAEDAKARGAEVVAPYKAECDNWKAEAERLKKELKMSDSSTAIFKVHFDTCQREFETLKMLIVEAENREWAENMKGAVKKLLEVMGGQI